MGRPSVPGGHVGYRVRVARMWWWPFGRVREITAAQLRERLERGDDLQLVDVRTGHEFNQDHLPGAVSIPITELAHRIDELDPVADHGPDLPDGTPERRGRAAARRA